MGAEGDVGAALDLAEAQGAGPAARSWPPALVTWALVEENVAGEKIFCVLASESTVKVRDPLMPPWSRSWPW